MGTDIGSEFAIDLMDHGAQPRILNVIEKLVIWPIIVAIQGSLDQLGKTGANLR